MPKKLALFGGQPIQETPLRPYVSVGLEEQEAVSKVMKNGIFSGFVAADDDRFYGGKIVKDFEEIFAKSHNAEYAVSFNSATSGLVAAIGALDIGLGDEVVVPAQTMSASAASIFTYNAVPVFADIESQTYGMCPESLRSRISEKTKAVMIVHLYGHPARMKEIIEIAKENDLRVIEDCSQAPLAKYNNQYVGTFGDIGIFSFNVHKHVNCGEGGIAITNNIDLKEKMSLIRNHGEVKAETKRLSNSIGWNFRLTEIQAAIAFEQTKKMQMLVNHKRNLAKYLSLLLVGFDWVESAFEEKNCKSSYYDYPMKFNFKKLGINKQQFMDITSAENLPITESYKPIYYQTIYQQKTVFGNHGFPFTESLSKKNSNSYLKGSCPNAEQMYEEECLTFEICSYDVLEEHMVKIADMFKKIERYAKA